MTHRYISGVYGPIIAASAEHLFCYLAKTLGFISFCPSSFKSAATLPSGIAYTNCLLSYLFSPFREQVNVEYLGEQKETELVVSPGTYCL